MKHRGPVCKECECEFYYDYLDKPEPHEGSGLCWECWYCEKLRTKANENHNGSTR